MMANILNGREGVNNAPVHETSRAPIMQARRRIKVAPEREYLPPPVDPVEENAESQVQSDEVTKNLQSLLSLFYVQNKEANEVRNNANATKKKLHTAMIKAGVKDLRCSGVQYKDSVTAVEASISREPKSVVSVDLLRRYVDDATFMKIVSATKDRVVEVVGETILIASTIEIEGKEDLHIRSVEEP